MMGNRKSKQEIVRPRSTMAKSVNYVRRDSYEEPDRYICSPRLNHPKIYVALYDYQARLPNEMSFKKGDLIEVISPGRDRESLIARYMMGSRQGGLVPAAYVAEKGSLRAQE